MTLSNNSGSTGARLTVHAVGLGSLLVIALAFYFLAYRGQTQQRVEHEMRADQLVQLLNGSSRASQEYDDQQKLLTRLQKEIGNVRSHVPETADDGAFLTALSDIAEEENLQITDYRRSRSTTHASHSQLELQLKCVGDYESLCRFVDRVQAMPRITRVSHINLQSVAGSRSYPFEIRLVLYHGLREPAEEPDIRLNERSTS